MVCATEAVGQTHSRSSTQLEIGCLVDTATGLLTFTANGKELDTYYQAGYIIIIPLVPHSLHFSLVQ